MTEGTLDTRECLILLTSREVVPCIAQGKQRASIGVPHVMATQTLPSRGCAEIRSHDLGVIRPCVIGGSDKGKACRITAIVMEETRMRDEVPSRW